MEHPENSRSPVTQHGMETLMHWREVLMEEQRTKLNDLAEDDDFLSIGPNAWLMLAELHASSMIGALMNYDIRSLDHGLQMFDDLIKMKRKQIEAAIKEIQDGRQSAGGRGQSDGGDSGQVPHTD